MKTVWNQRNSDFFPPPIPPPSLTLNVDTSGKKKKGCWENMTIAKIIIIIIIPTNHSEMEKA